MRKIYTNYALFLFLTLGIFASGNMFGQAPVINSIQGPLSVCSQPADAITYSTSATNAPSSYAWSASPSGGVVISNPSSGTTSISFPYPYLNPTFTLYCYATNGSGSSQTTSVVVNVYETPTITFSGANSFCQGSSTNLSASPTILSSSSTLTYSWMPSTGLSATTGHSVNAQPPATTNYTVLLTLGNCTNTAQLTVFVYSAPCPTVGIAHLEANEANALLVYPNPSHDYFILKSGKDELAVILNEIGQTVRSLPLIAGTETKVTGLPGGIYFVLTSTSRKKIVITN